MEGRSSPSVSMILQECPRNNLLTIIIVSHTVQLGWRWHETSFGIPSRKEFVSILGNKRDNWVDPLETPRPASRELSAKSTIDNLSGGLGLHGPGPLSEIVGRHLLINAGYSMLIWSWVDDDYF